MLRKHLLRMKINREMRQLRNRLAHVYQDRQATFAAEADLVEKHKALENRLFILDLGERARSAY